MFTTNILQQTTATVAKSPKSFAKLVKRDDEHEIYCTFAKNLPKIGEIRNKTLKIYMNYI